MLNDWRNVHLCDISKGYWASLIAQLVKNLPAMQETLVWSLGSEDSPGEGIGYPLQYSWASLVAQLVKNCWQYGRPGFDPWVGKTPWRRERLPTPVFWHGEFHGLYSPWGCKESDKTDFHLITKESSKEFLYAAVWNQDEQLLKLVSQHVFYM